MQLSARRRGTLALIVTALALAQVMGAALGSTTILHIGMALGFAPLPRPFGGVGGYESFAARHTATLIYASGERDVIDLHTLTRYLQGPHRAKITYLQAFAYMPTFSIGYTSPLLSSILCDRVPEVLRRDRPTRAELLIESDTVGWEHYRYIREVACPSV